MTACRTLAEIEAAGREAERAIQRTREQADSVAAILAPHLAAITGTQAA